MRIRTYSMAVAAVLLGLAFAAPAFAVGIAVQPGNAAADGFLPSTACGCHAARVEEWTPSMHAQAIVDTVFLTKVTEAEAAVGAETARFCKRCHSPIGNMTSDFDGTASAVAGEGVTCMYCHQVTDLAGAPRNVSHLVMTDGTRRAQLKEPTAPHPAAYSVLHTSAEFCGGCHNVDHPTNGTHLESTYAEWAAGPYAKEGVVCQDCHMSSKPGSVVGPFVGVAGAGGAERDNIFAMSFVGANVGQGPAAAAVALLVSAATVDLEMPEFVAAGSTASMTVTITNKGAGHYLPTGLTEVREMWLSVVAVGSDGATESIGERRFGTVLRDAKGAYPAEMWEATAIQSDDRIPPRGSVKSNYSFTMPKGATQGRVVATLYYRSVPDELAVKAGVKNPTTEMAAQTRVLYASQAAKDAAAKGSRPLAEAPVTSAVWMFATGGALLAMILAVGVVILRRRRRA